MYRIMCTPERVRARFYRSAGACVDSSLAAADGGRNRGSTCNRGLDQQVRRDRRRHEHEKRDQQLVQARPCRPRRSSRSRQAAQLRRRPCSALVGPCRRFRKSMNLHQAPRSDQREQRPRRPPAATATMSSASGDIASFDDVSAQQVLREGHGADETHHRDDQRDLEVRLPCRSRCRSGSAAPPSSRRACRARGCDQPTYGPRSNRQAASSSATTKAPAATARRWQAGSSIGSHRRWPAAAVRSALD